jgi:CRP-like cAMP-binding protein
VEEGLCHYVVSFRAGKETATSLFLPMMTIAFAFDHMSGDIRVITDCVLYRMDSAIIYALPRTEPELYNEYYKLMIYRVSGALTGATLNAQFTPERRLMVFLQILAMDCRKAVKINGTVYHSVGYKISHEQISIFINTNRVTVSKIIAKWLQKKIVVKVDGLLAVNEDIFRSELYQ